MIQITLKQEKALTALLTCPTARAAAKAAGIDERTLRRYWQDPEFLAEYRRRCAELLDTATDRAKAAVVPAVERLAGIIADDKQQPQTHIAACRAMIEYTLRLYEASDVEHRLRELEERSAEHEK